MTDREIARTVCTPSEYTAWDLADRGMSQRAIALHLGLTRSSVRSRLEEARRKIDRQRRKANAA